MTVRRLAPGEVDLLRDIRLRALKDAPLAFSSNYASEAAFEPAEWERRARENAAWWSPCSSARSPSERPRRPRSRRAPSRPASSP